MQIENLQTGMFKKNTIEHTRIQAIIKGGFCYHTPEETDGKDSSQVNKSVFIKITTVDGTG